MKIILRRRLIRPPAPPDHSPPETDPYVQRLRARLSGERTTLARWMSRLKRACHTGAKTQSHITRLERLIARLED
jgi:hypothetical protein